MNVKLITWTPNPEKTVAAAARLCYSSVPASEIAQNIPEEDVGKLIETLIQKGHESPLEHASFTFTIDGVSRALSHQLVRHRIASYSQKSQRYVDEKEFNWVMPPSIDENPAARNIYYAQIGAIRQAYALLCAVVPREDARYILPNACETSLVMTMNARSLLHFFRVRGCQKAQWEIRQLAGMMLEEVRKVAPVLFRNAGPPCKTWGKCPEGEATCGLQGLMDEGDEV